ncbi:MAG TPA: hypothetical protein VF436_08035, partial [Dyella sp.]
GAGPLISGSGVAIGAVSGGVGGYISGGWKGAVIGVAMGAAGGKYMPRVAGYVGGKFDGMTGMFASSTTFALLNGTVAATAAASTNLVQGNPWSQGVPYAFAAGTIVPIASGEAALIGFGGEAAVGLKVTNAYGAYSGLFSIGAAAVEPKARKGDVKMAND